MKIEQKSKVIAEYLGWVYVPHNDLKDFPKAGWWKPVYTINGEIFPAKLLSGATRIGNTFWKFVCRNHNQLRFYNSFDELIPVLNKLIEEDLREYMYSWEQCIEGDEEGCELETQYNFEYIAYDIYAPINKDCATIYVNLTLDPAFDIGECKGKGIIKNTFEACYQAIEYINKIKKL